MNARELNRQYLLAVAKAVDITDSQKEEAHRRYMAVADWLSNEDSALNKYDPDIYPQGSFALGTVVRPLNREDEFDMDLVIELMISKDQITQRALKAMVGDRLMENATYAKMIEEKNRCWQLHYAEGAQFHMDVLPGIPEEERRRLAESMGFTFGAQSILIPDRELREWHYTNPRGYREWFIGRTQRVYNDRRSAMAFEAKVDIAEVPEYKISTPMQRAVQILKRHRDVMFGDHDDKPISIIISTMAGKHYSDQDNIVDALDAIIQGMMQDQAIASANIKNPVDERENFADKWEKHPQRQEAFINWVHRAYTDLTSLRAFTDIDSIHEGAQRIFGKRFASDAAKATAAIFGTATQASAHNEPRPPRVEVKEAKPWRP